MAIREIPEIPATKEWCCDLRKKTEINQARPAYWGSFYLQQDAYDYQGAAVADASIRRLLCEKCKVKVINVLNSGL